MNWLNRLKFKDGLIPAIAQDAVTGEVLMMAYMDRQALLKTIKTKRCHYYSRSRARLWLKGESSGHIQKVKSLMTDCDMDCLLIKVEQTGGACHTGYKSCFYRQAKGPRLCLIGKKVFDPKKVY
ncbi:MAG: phosphoribosyl-AMP cyclohydrolase [Candidatus Omnitrophota bacterium]|jgi:phosphoribosyl-AMP cyclohydrolase